MRVTSADTLHLTWLPWPARWPGIVARLREQGRAAQRGTLGLRLAVAAGAALEPSEGLEVLRVDQRCAVLWPLAARLARYRLLEELIDPGCVRLILRMPGACDPSLPAFLRHWGRRCVTEHHGDELAERRQLGQGAGAVLRLRGEARALRLLLGGVAGAIGVTPEIAARCALRAPRPLPTTAVGNGIDCAALPWRARRPWRDGPLELAMLLGSPAPWHGLDRLQAGLARHRGEPRIRLHLIGGSIDGGDWGPAAECLVHPHLQGAALEALLDRVHLAVASLALHRAGLRQACPLKSRAYAARGLPFVYAYDDPDLPAGLPGAIRLPTGEEPIEAGRLIAAAAMTDAAAGAALRAHAERVFDWQKVLGRELAFVRRLCP